MCSSGGRASTRGDRRATARAQQGTVDGSTSRSAPSRRVGLTVRCRSSTDPALARDRRPARAFSSALGGAGAGRSCSGAAARSAGTIHISCSRRWPCRRAGTLNAAYVAPNRTAATTGTPRTGALTSRPRRRFAQERRSVLPRARSGWSAVCWGTASLLEASRSTHDEDIAVGPMDNLGTDRAEHYALDGVQAAGSDDRQVGIFRRFNNHRPRVTLGLDRFCLDPALR
jgi:hypothetical protein